MYHLLELPVIIGLQVGRARVHHVDEAVGACRTLGVKRQQNKNLSGKILPGVLGWWQQPAYRRGGT